MQNIQLQAVYKCSLHFQVRFYSSSAWSTWLWKQDASALLLLQERCFSSKGPNASPKHQGKSLFCSKQQKLPSSLIPQAIQEILHLTEWKDTNHVIQKQSQMENTSLSSAQQRADLTMLVLSLITTVSLVSSHPGISEHLLQRPGQGTRHRCATGAAIPCPAHFPNLSSQRQNRQYGILGLETEKFKKVRGRYWDNLGSIPSGVVWHRQHQPEWPLVDFCVWT